jgi:hypothetical protein
MNSNYYYYYYYTKNVNIDNIIILSRNIVLNTNDYIHMKIKHDIIT